MNFKMVLFTMGAVTLAGCGVGPLGQTKGIQNAVRELQFTPINPATNAYVPGTIMRVVSNDPFKAGVVCDSVRLWGAEPVELMENESLSGEWRRKSENGLKVDSGDIERINAKLEAKYVSDISVSLSNTKVHEITDVFVIDRARKNVTDEACKGALSRWINQKTPMTLIKQGLYADVVYKVNFTRELSAEAKANITDKIAPELSISGKREGIDVVHGKQLYFGVWDDQELLRAFTEELEGVPTLPRPESSDSTRLLGPRIVIVTAE